MAPLRSLFDWLDARTGYRAGRSHLLDEPLPSGVGWWFVTGSILLFLLGGSLASWARGGPETTNDIDLMVRREDAKRAQDALAAAGMRAECTIADRPSFARIAPPPICPCVRCIGSTTRGSRFCRCSAGNSEGYSR